MEKKNILTTAEEVKAGAMTLIGAGIFSQGTLYFQEQSNYNIPRILYPVYIALGNKGLAVAMIILGLGLIYYAFTKWKKYAGNLIVFGVIGAVSMVLFFSILLLTSNKKTTSEDLITASDERKTKLVEEMKTMEQPDFGDQSIEKHYGSFENLLAKYKEANQAKDTTAIELLQKDFVTWCEQASVLSQKLKSTKEMQQMALYNGKLVMQWQAVNP